MLSQSRINQAKKSFIQTLDTMSNQIIQHYFKQNTILNPSPYIKKQSLTDLYTFVYSSSTSKPSYQQQMFQTYKSMILNHSIKYMPILNNSLHTNQVIVYYNKIWDSYICYLKILNNRVFSYLNRYYVQNNDQQSILKVGYKMFSQTFLVQTNIKIFFDPYIRKLDQFRISKIINHDYLLQFTLSFVLMGNVSLLNKIKEIYLISAENYYKRVFQQNCNNQPIVYISYIKNLRYFQIQLAKNCICFTQQQQNTLDNVFNTQLIQKYTQILAVHPHGLSFMLQKHKIDDLKLIYTLYDKNQGFVQIKRWIYDIITNQGNIILNQSNKSTNSAQFVNKIYKFYKIYQKTINHGFHKKSQIISTLNNTLQKLICKYDRITQDLYKYTRNELDIGKWDEISEQIMTIFQKIPYKDEYLALYRKSLQNKILSSSLIYLIESKFISDMNKICNSQITGDLQKILDDCIQSPNTLNIDGFNVKVLSLELWQKHFKDQININLNPIGQLKNKWQQFQKQYMNMFPKRKLLLLALETKIILKMITNKNQMNIKCNFVQACIIMYIGQKVNIGQIELLIDLGIDKSVLQRILQQFPTILYNQINNTLSLNWNFQALHLNVDIDTKFQTQKQIKKHVNQDRDILLQFTVVKIVKKIKKINKQQLLIASIAHIKLFRPNMIMLDIAIQTAIKKDLVQMDEEGRILYKE